MSFAGLAASVRSAFSASEITLNRLRGREFIPAQPDMLNIETSSLCNLKCRFCAYVKKHSPKVSMKNEFFFDCVGQALEMGYRRFEMTPCTGDVFMDRHLFQKLDFLERHPEVKAYRFFTNFTIPRPSDVHRLAALKKLEHLTISVYGHDVDSFVALTQSTPMVYRRLIANLETLLPLLERKAFDLEIGFRCTRSTPRKAASELMELLDRFSAAGVAVRRSSGRYNNWGGSITQEDVRGLAIDIKGAEGMYKRGACALLFTTVQIMATGVVNGCACRDAEATLRIGDMREKPLREIISPRNPIYMGLIEEQQRGQFRPVCQSCDFYKSIYHMRPKYLKDGPPLQSLQDFMGQLETR